MQCRKYEIGTALALYKVAYRANRIANYRATIEQAKQNNQCDIAQRLYAYKAQSGDVDIALNYARRIRSRNRVSTGCFGADKETAIYWYEAVLITTHKTVTQKRVLKL